MDEPRSEPAEPPPDTAGNQVAQQGESMEIHPPHGPIRSFKEFSVQLITITTGILIALSLEGLVEWNHYRALVREARATISREIADNTKELDEVLAESDTRTTSLDTALRLIDELVSETKSGGKNSRTEKINLGFTMADLSMASWHSAERTGALGHMEYSEVQQYSQLYDTQQLFAQQQRRSLERLALTLSVLGHGDSRSADPKDLEALRQHILALRGELVIEEQIGRQLAEVYQTALKKQPSHE
jgi:hypothetical protein